MGYGIDFPFMESTDGSFLKITQEPEKEVRANLIHLLLTRKGSRYFLPDFGTRLYQYIFEQNDMVTWGLIRSEIQDSVKKYIPNLDITNIEIKSTEDEPKGFEEMEDERLFRVSDNGMKAHTAKVKIEYTINNSVFDSSDFIIINI
jgi:phage baseplate assembly protein W